MPDQIKTKSAGSVTRAHTETGSAPTRAMSRAQRRVVVVGAPGDVPRALEHPAVGRGAFVVAAVLAVDVESSEGLQGLDQLAELLEAHEAEAVLLAGPIGSSTMRRVADLALLNHCELLAVMPTEVLAGHDPVIVWSGDSPLVQLAGLPRTRFDTKLKRAADVAGACVGLAVSAPVVALLALLIRLESKGSPIFRHVRVGLNGRRFNCLKLRTMRADAEDHLRNDPQLYDDYRRNHFKLPDRRDPRVTLLGRFLRRTSLDELPQLWNVLVGDMSLVGPRPVIEEELGMYGNSSELLLSVRPGLTGAWAVSGRHNVGYPERCSIELEYVRHWNLRRDADIVFRTLRVIATPERRQNQPTL
jgi:exopolysaccharide production protein ExoY